MFFSTFVVVFFLLWQLLLSSFLAVMLSSGIMLKVLSLWLFVTTVLCQRDAWLTPDGSQPDNTNAFNNADQVEIAWNAMGGDLSDLWLNAVGSDYAIRLGSNINISVAGTYPWTITVGDEEIQVDAHFQLSFVPTGTGFKKADVAEYEQSPVFILIKRGEALPSAMSTTLDATPTPTTISDIAPTFTSGAATPTSDANNSDGSSGTSTGMKAGIAIGVVAAVAIILVLLFWALRLRRKVKAANNKRSSGIVPASGVMPNRAEGPSEKRISGVHEVRGDNVQPVEMNARPKTVYHELSG
jgi:hypothetical protein